MEVIIPDELNEEWKHSRHNTSLAKELVLLCWHLGISGEKIYIPTRESRIKVITRNLLEEIEAAYMEDGVTFILEKNARAMFSSRFSVRKVQERYRIATRTSLEATRRAYKRWSYWFRKKEEPLLQQIQEVGAANRIGYGKMSFYYKEIRQRLRQGESPAREDYEALPGAIVDFLINMAKVSIGNCNWNPGLRKKVHRRLPEEIEEAIPESVLQELIEEARQDDDEAEEDDYGLTVVDSIVLRDPELSLAERATFAILRSFGQRKRYCCLTLNRLARVCGLAREYVARIIHTLHKKNLITLKYVEPESLFVCLIHPEKRYPAAAEEPPRWIAAVNN